MINWVACEARIRSDKNAQKLKRLHKFYCKPPITEFIGPTSNWDMGCEDKRNSMRSFYALSAKNAQK
jgi:hypothetical protein